MNKIFISIASYKDPLLENTIKEAYSKARHKDNLVFGILEQNFETDSINLDNFEFKNQIRYSRVDPELSKGVCWARSIVQGMYDNEEYYFQIDSHMLFEENWDEYFISCFTELKRYHDKPIITGYPLNFNSDTFEKESPYPEDRIAVILTNNKRQRDKHFVTLGFSPPWGHVNYKTPHKMIHGYYIGACCLFAEGIFVKEIPYDDSIFFGGEEPMLTLRAWTHGYNIFHVGNLHVYHCWQRNYRVGVHNDLAPGRNEIHRKNTKNYIQRMIRGEITGRYGIGNVRSVQQYIDFSGIDYFNYVWQDKNNIFEMPYYQQLTV